MLISALVCFLSFTVPFAHAQISSIYDVKEQRNIPLQLIDEKIGFDHQIVVLGETHYNKSIQQAQADLIAATTDTPPLIAWEFLSLVDSEKVQNLAHLVRNEELSADQFVESLTGEKDSSYTPIFQLLRSLNAEVAATNLTREQKRPVTRGGLSALEPGLLPDQFELGSDGYFSRFEEAMGGHTHGFKIENLFASQCLTDDVIADTLTKWKGQAPIYLVVGSFHSDYNQGVVERLNTRSQGEKEVINVRFLTQDELKEMTLEEWAEDKQHGPIADYIIVTGS